MIIIERKPGESVTIGPYTLQVLAVHAGEVVVALIDPAKDCLLCGERPAHRHCCPLCQVEVVVCPACVRAQSCPRCASPWQA